MCKLEVAVWSKYKCTCMLYAFALNSIILTLYQRGCVDICTFTNSSCLCCVHTPVIRHPVPTFL